jgi:small conductance mechanosensitive channel
LLRSSTRLIDYQFWNQSKGIMEDILKELKSTLVKHLGEKSLDFVGKLIGAAIIVAAGFVLAKWIGRIMDRGLARHDLEPPVRNLIVRVVRVLTFLLVLLIALEQLGLPITTLIAGVSVAGVGLGLAMQGVLGNLVAGLVIIFTKPFRVGEYIEIIGVQGTVSNIDLLTTMLQHGDLSRVKVPNRKIIGEVLHNYGKIRQLDLSVGVAYSTNAEEAMAVINDILQTNPRVLKDPAPAVGITSLAESSVVISVKPWVNGADFGPAGGEINLAILENFRQRGIEIPFPQREIRVLESGAVPQKQVPSP